MKWSEENEEKLRGIAGNRLAIIQRSSRKRLLLEVASNQRAELHNIAKDFGGRVEKLPGNWLKRSLHRRTNPIRVGDSSLIIPAGAAFGTGEHATTAMCLRLLERVTRFREAAAPSRSRTFSATKSRQDPAIGTRQGVRSPEWVVDLGTGSGILALAAKRLGATRVLAIDNDPIAISTAKQNARLNKIRQVIFRVGDVRKWKFEREITVVTANLFSELLIEIVPKLRSAQWLILSGVLRSQEPELRRVLRRNKFDLIKLCRRGKWVAILARRK